MIILQILGAIVLAIIVLIVAVYLFFRFKFGKYLQQEYNEPLTIHLFEDISPDWLEEKQVTAAKDELVSLGFTVGKAYTVDEMEALSLLHLHKSPINAVLYQHDIAGTWVDFYLIADDGREFTVNNVPMGSEIESRPNCVKHTDKEATLTQLYQKIENISKEVQSVTFTPDEFRAVFEDVYKKDMAWRVHRGGASYDEFVKTAKASKAFKNMKEDKLKEAFSLHKLQELQEWHYAALQEYANKQGDEESDEVFYASFIVPENAHIPALLNYFEEQDFINEKQLEKLQKALANKTKVGAYAVFEKINSLRSPEKRATLIATQDYPLPLRIYRQKDQ